MTETKLYPIDYDDLLGKISGEVNRLHAYANDLAKSTTDTATSLALKKLAAKLKKLYHFVNLDSYLRNLYG